MNAARAAQKVCRLNVNGTTVSGEGATEEEARENVLKKVKEMVRHSPVSPCGEMLSVDMNSTNLGSGRPANVNMVGRLQEFCVAKHWPLPVYNLVNAQGPSHMPHFHMMCSVRDFVAVGNGKTKQEAKHSAAKNLMDLIREAGNPDRGSVPVGRVPPLCAPVLVSRQVDIVYRERRKFQSPHLQSVPVFEDYRETSPLRSRPLLALKGKEDRDRCSSAERLPRPISEATECSREPIPLPSVEDYLCGRFQDQLKVTDVTEKRSLHFTMYIL
ncbi:uncharacterized protein LOC124789605 isoform X1 [Schistocerca piceifrons]|uniref:uncharacterized protein LOC124789605 isoform X1 n=1 Tax=Schistocerca piceifrons TaxID=274613 RepID=UPI001F5FDE7E|nr:uncharacterized protein LOC124789605 isoform X1 [Schistocerca piceifrons]XP_047112972.1 uncharacterized protein LOC124789605 isoform X1 [Schistocerca piceifrons]XP_047112973.1 uncharacterized protein LOC124789605 isoform X1 [Schistocerca piceifrons]XP_047112974.1 uncharacterized protein LOC124789605 isoform X1 [Schistocerca piceifrons]